MRVSPLRKSRLVLDNIRGKSVADAIAILTFTPNKLQGSSLKCWRLSACKRWKQLCGLEKANLVVSEAFANEGPTMKRFRHVRRVQIRNQQTYSSHHSNVCRRKPSKLVGQKVQHQLVCVLSICIRGGIIKWYAEKKRIRGLPSWRSCNP